MIPEAAVTAAMEAFLLESIKRKGELSERPFALLAALEAAAPYLLAQAWDRAVESMVYDDGTPVEVMSNNNPYRTTK